MARKLKDILVKEISFVDRPANRKSFLVIKGEVMKEKLIELLKAFGRQESEELSNVEQLPKETQDILSKAFDVFLKFQPDMPQELLDAHADVIEVIAAIVPVEKTDETEDQTQEADADDSEDTQETPEDILKALKELVEKAQTLLKEDSSEEETPDNTNTEENSEEEEKITQEDVKKMISEVLLESAVGIVKEMVSNE